MHVVGALAVAVGRGGALQPKAKAAKASMVGIVLKANINYCIFFINACKLLAEMRRD